MMERIGRQRVTRCLPRMAVLVAVVVVVVRVAQIEEK